MSDNGSRFPAVIQIVMPEGPQPMVEIRAVKRFLQNTRTYACWWNAQRKVLDLREGRDFALIHRGRVLPRNSKFRRDAKTLVTLEAANRIAGKQEERGAILVDWLDAWEAGIQKPSSDLLFHLDVLEALRESPGGFSLPTAARLLRMPPRALCARLRASKWLSGFYGIRRAGNPDLIGNGLMSQPMRIRSLSGEFEMASPSIRITLQGLYVLRTGHDADLT